MAKTISEMIGPTAFVIGIVLAVVLGLVPKILGGSSANILILGVLGIVVGILNVTSKELNNYIIANIGFIVGAAAFMGVLSALTLGVYSSMLVYVVQNIILFVAPGLAVVCLREIYSIMKD